MQFRLGNDDEQWNSIKSIQVDEIFHFPWSLYDSIARRSLISSRLENICIEPSPVQQSPENEEFTTSGVRTQDDLSDVALWPLHYRRSQGLLCGFVAFPNWYVPLVEISQQIFGRSPFLNWLFTMNTDRLLLLRWDVLEDWTKLTFAWMMQVSLDMPKTQWPSH
jgi:hypothetical protein